MLRVLMAAMGGLLAGWVARAAVPAPVQTAGLAEPPPADPGAADELLALRQLWKVRRHDVRGALSPALLMADRLTSHADRQVQRSAEIIVQSLQRAIDALADPAPPEP